MLMFLEDFASKQNENLNQTQGETFWDLKRNKYNKVNNRSFYRMIGVY